MRYAAVAQAGSAFEARPAHQVEAGQAPWLGAARLRCAARRERTTLRAAAGGVVTGAMLAPEHEGWRVWTAINGAETLAGVGATRPISRTCRRPSPTAAAPRVAGPLGPGVPCAGGSRSG